MPDNPLLQQLASRARIWHGNTGVPQSLMAKEIGMADGNYSAFLSGRRGIGAEATCLLLKYLAMPKREVIAKFSKPAPTSKILHLQQRDTRKMRLDGNDGWVPGQSGVDPNDVDNGIDNAPDADTAGPTWDPDLIDTLREVRRYHRKAIRAMNQYIAQAKVNAGITIPSGVAQKFGQR